MKEKTILMPVKLLLVASFIVTASAELKLNPNFSKSEEFSSSGQTFKTVASANEPHNLEALKLILENAQQPKATTSAADLKQIFLNELIKQQKSGKTQTDNVLPDTFLPGQQASSSDGGSPLFEKLAKIDKSTSASSVNPPGETYQYEKIVHHKPNKHDVLEKAANPSTQTSAKVTESRISNPSGKSFGKDFKIGNLNNPTFQSMTSPTLQALLGHHKTISHPGEDNASVSFAQYKEAMSYMNKLIYAQKQAMIDALIRTQLQKMQAQKKASLSNAQLVKNIKTYSNVVSKLRSPHNFNLKGDKTKFNSKPREAENRFHHPPKHSCFSPSEQDALKRSIILELYRKGLLNIPKFLNGTTNQFTGNTKQTLVENILKDRLKPLFMNYLKNILKLSDSIRKMTGLKTKMTTTTPKIDTGPPKTSVTSVPPMTNLTRSHFQDHEPTTMPPTTASDTELDFDDDYTAEDYDLEPTTQLPNVSTLKEQAVESNKTGVKRHGNFSGIMEAHTVNKNVEEDAVVGKVLNVLEDGNSTVVV